MLIYIKSQDAYIHVKSQEELEVEVALNSMLRRVADNGGPRLHLAAEAVKTAFELADMMASPLLDQAGARFAKLTALKRLAEDLNNLAVARAALADEATHG